MRIVFPHVAAHPQAVAALDAHAPGAERFFLGYRPDAYWALLAELWAAGEGFLLVEHDIEIRAGLVTEADTCPQPWCVWPYAGAGWSTGGDPLLYQSLGCTRFAAGLLAAEPDLMAEVGAVSEGLPAKDWRRLDVTIGPRLNWRGYQPHRHGPPVTHHHNYPGEGCSCGWQAKET